MIERSILQTSLVDALKKEGYAKADDIAFHMADWLKDLDEIYTLFNDIENQSSEEIEKLLMGFLIHVPNHVAAASMLMNEIPVEDVFGVGAVAIDSENSDRT